MRVTNSCVIVTKELIVQEYPWAKDMEITIHKGWGFAGRYFWSGFWFSSYETGVIPSIACDWNQTEPVTLEWVDKMATWHGENPRAAIGAW